MTSESNIAALGLALKVVKRPKRSAVLDAGMRITGEKTTFGQEVEREQKHTTGQKRKQPGKRSPVQVQRKKDLSLLMRCSYVAAYQERCELLLILLPLTGHRRLEKRGDELQRLPSSHTCVVYCSRTLNTSLLCLVHWFDLIPPSAKYAQELKSCNVRLL